MSWHAHNGTGAIADYNVVGYPDRNFLIIGRIDGVGTGKDAGFFFFGCYLPLDVSLGPGLLNIALGLGPLIGS